MKKSITNHRVLYVLALPILLFNTSCNRDSEPIEKPEVGPTLADHQRPVGESSHELLSNSTYTDLRIEVVSEEGFSMAANVQSDLISFLEQYLNKSNITFSSKEIPESEDGTFDLAELKRLEEANRSNYIEEGDMALYIFIAGGSYIDDNVLGLAYYNTSCAIMGGKVRSLSGGLGQPSEDLVMQTVLRHELGHLLGLVDNGSPQQNDHVDAAHGSHCMNENCLMYYAVETGDFVSNLVGSDNPPSLDANCQEDLKANGGK